MRKCGKRAGALPRRAPVIVQPVINGSPVVRPAPTSKIGENLRRVQHGRLRAHLKAGLTGPDDSDDGVARNYSDSWNDTRWAKSDVTVTGPAGKWACLNAWLDYSDGTAVAGTVETPNNAFDANEHVVNNLPIQAGARPELVTLAAGIRRDRTAPQRTTCASASCLHRTRPRPSLQRRDVGPDRARRRRLRPPALRTTARWRTTPGTSRRWRWTLASLHAHGDGGRRDAGVGDGERGRERGVQCVPGWLGRRPAKQRR